MTSYRVDMLGSVTLFNLTRCLRERVNAGLCHSSGSAYQG